MLVWYDFKAFSEQTHIKYTGVSNNLIKENLVKLCNDGANVEIRIPYVPNCNSLEMEDIAKFICKLKIKGVRILPYHNLFGSKNVAIGLNANIPEIVPTTEEIESVIKLFESYNINVLK